MRTQLVNRATVALLLLSAAGCSSTQPFWSNFSWRKPAATSSSAMTSPPPFVAAGTSSQSVTPSSGPQLASAAMPVYPGTPYPVTPYPPTSGASIAGASNSTYPTNLSAAPAAGAPVGGYMPQNVAGGASAQPANPYAAGQVPAYGATPSQPYYAPQSDSYNAAASQPGAYTR